jgi:Zn finger protein HypA/HybF involved in hydrogenase expression
MIIKCSNCQKEFEPKKPYWKMCPYCASGTFKSKDSAYNNQIEEEMEYYGCSFDDWVDPLN